MTRPITFWFEFASTYSYLSAMRIEALAEVRGVDVIWKPFLLGPIFKTNGWETSPFSIYPERGQNMWRDMERRAERYGIAFNLNAEDLFPQNSVLAARAAIACLQEDWGREFCRRVFRAAFVEARNIADPETISDCIEAAGGDAGEYLRMAHNDAQKSVLRLHVDEARSRGIYGAPSFIVDDELFWGDDRLEDALDWATRR